MKKLIIVGDSFGANYVEQMNSHIDEVSSNEAKVMEKWQYIKPFPIWPELVAQHLNCSLTNISISGIGNWALYSIALDTILKEKDFKTIASFIDETVKISIKIQNDKGKKLVDFKKDIEKNEEIINLRERVNNFSKDLYFPSDLDIDDCDLN